MSKYITPVGDHLDTVRTSFTLDNGAELVRNSARLLRAMLGFFFGKIG